MNREQVISRLETAGPELRQLGITGLYLFGSYARAEAGDASDVDVFVDGPSIGKFDFDAFMAGYEALQRALPGADIQYGTRQGLSKYIRADVEREAIRIL
jgi:predicted nucleotidyltransferase